MELHDFGCSETGQRVRASQWHGVILGRARRCNGYRQRAYLFSAVVWKGCTSGNTTCFYYTFGNARRVSPITFPMRERRLYQRASQAIRSKSLSLSLSLSHHPFLRHLPFKKKKSIQLWQQKFMVAERVVPFDTRSRCRR